MGLSTHPSEIFGETLCKTLGEIVIENLIETSAESLG